MSALSNNSGFICKANEKKKCLMVICVLDLNIYIFLFPEKLGETNNNCESGNCHDGWCRNIYIHCNLSFYLSYTSACLIVFFIENTIVSIQTEDPIFIMFMCHFTFTCMTVMYKTIYCNLSFFVFF